MDALSDVLRITRLTGAVFLNANLTAPWSLVTRVEPEVLGSSLPFATRIIGFHYVLKGELVAQVPGGPLQKLKAGDLVVFPHNDLHVLGSASGLWPEPACNLKERAADSEIWELKYGGGGEETQMVCGFLGSDSVFNPVLAALPPMLTMSVSKTPAGGWLAESFAFAVRQLAAGSAGSASIVGRLSELMFVEAVRLHIEGLPEEEKGWLAALRDKAVGKALALMHAEPARVWSSDTLAKAVNLSRSAFTDRFSALVGQPPKRYLTTWRMQVAARDLLGTPKTVAQISFEAGYESDAGFNKAFRREFGHPPATWRQRHMQAGAPEAADTEGREGVAG